MSDTTPGELLLGAVVDASSHQRTDTPVSLDADDLTTHGVIVGMTGSGKTGLGVVLIEEVLSQGIPALVIDPKGDMGNLLLGFDDLAPASFEPWIDAVAAQRDGVSVKDRAAQTAAMWKEGLARSGIGPERISALHDAVDFAIYTPGSTAGIPLDVIGNLRAPATDDPETRADEIEGFASSVLGLVGIDADPLSSREHILISNLIDHAWSNGDDIDMAALIGQIQQPPLRKLGVIDLDTFFPPADRMALALKLNGLMASPSFASWVQGAPLDMDALLHTPDGRPRCAVVSIAHLSDAERQFVVTLVLSKLVTWMRAQPGTTGLRAMVYMDEVFGFVPPSAVPPAKKPILTILKQARAFGVGMVLSTQNPVDLDYKAISNAGTWLVGRLQTERDKARLLEGMTSASGAIDVGEVDATISGLGAREFLLFSTRRAQPTVFGTRWAMSYLPGPLTREQIGSLMDPRRVELLAGTRASTEDVDEAAPVPASGPAGDVPLAADETAAPPPIAEGVRTAFLDPAAPWGPAVGAVPGGSRFEPALVARVHLLFDETTGDIRHEQEWEAVVFPLHGDRASTEDLHVVDYDDRDLRDDAPDGARFVITDARLSTKAYFTAAQRALVDHIHRSETLILAQNKPLKLVSRPGEAPEEFARRCARAADDAVDIEADELRKKFDARMQRAAAALSTAEDRLREAESDAANRGKDEIISGVGDLLGGLFGGRKSARSIIAGIKRAGGKRGLREKAAERVRTAENKLAQEAAELEELRTDLEEALLELDAEWADAATSIEELQVTLEKNDIAVEQLAVLWIPTA